MTNISLDLSGKIDPLTADLLSALTEAAQKANVDFFVTGAAARDLILEQGYGISTGRRTQDIDFGVMVNGWEVYDQLKGLLVATGHFAPERNVIHRLRYRGTLPIDIIPFGEIESPPGSVTWPPDQAIRMNVLGFRDAWKSVLIVRVGPALTIRCVSLSGMAVLKLIAWNERRDESPEKDIADLALLLRNYGQAGNDERLYGDHSNWLEAEGFDLERAGARLLGHDMAEMMNDRTQRAILDILEREADPGTSDRLIVGVANELPGRDYETGEALLRCLREGIEGNRPRKTP